MKAQKMTSLCKKKTIKQTNNMLKLCLLYGLCFLIKVWAHQKKRICAVNSEAVPMLHLSVMRSF